MAARPVSVEREFTASSLTPTSLEMHFDVNSLQEGREESAVWEGKSQLSGRLRGLRPV